MIEINLLPQELKVESKKFSIKYIQPKHLLYFILAAFGVLICLHIYLAAFGVAKNYQFRRLSRIWRNLEPRIKILEEFKKEHETLSVDAKIIQRLISQRINWAEKLNKLSIDLPSGVWFNELSLSQKEFILKAAVISLQKEELNLINQFMNNLKNDATFFKDFNALELSSVQRKTISGYEIVDFILQGRLK